MDFSKNRLEALAGLGNSETRHAVVREQAEALNEAAEVRQADKSEDQVRQAVRRTIRKMVAEGTLSLESLDFLPGRAMEEAEGEEAAEEETSLEEGEDTHMSGPMLEDEDEMPELAEADDFGTDWDAEAEDEDHMEEDCGEDHEEVLEEDSVEDVDGLDVMEEDYVEVIQEEDGVVIKWGGKEFVER